MEIQFSDDTPERIQAIYISAVIDTCSEGGHKFMKLPGHPGNRCPNCMAIGLDKASIGVQYLKGVLDMEN